MDPSNEFNLTAFFLEIPDPSTPPMIRVLDIFIIFIILVVLVFVCVLVGTEIGRCIYAYRNKGVLLECGDGDWDSEVGGERMGVGSEK